MKKQKKKTTAKQCKELTPKQQRFCDEYLKDLNGTQAAIRAGYSEKTANEQAARALANVSIQEYIQNKQKEIGNKNNLTAEWFIKKAKKILRRCLEEEELKDRNGNGLGIWRFDSTGANKALEMLARHGGLFNDKLKLAGDKDSPLTVEHVQIYIPDNKRG